MNRYVAIFLVVFSYVSSTGAQIGAKAKNNIHGNWTNLEFGYEMKLRLNPDGSGEFDGERIEFVTTDDKLAVKQQGISTIYSYVLMGSSLRISGGDLEQVVVFTREDANDRPVASNPVGSAPVPKDLVGTWSGYNETIEFKDRGECVYHGQRYQYSVAGNEIQLHTPQGKLLMTYHVKGNQLNIALNGQTLTYWRGDAENMKPGTGIDASLVGQWCYMNVYSSNTGGSSASECITLKNDGTYEYYAENSRSVSTNTLSGGTASQNSDRGTWWVQGDRIHYHSQSQGQGSYSLVKQNHPKTNEPMIVLEGRTYVTATVKSPW